MHPIRSLLGTGVLWLSLALTAQAQLLSPDSQQRSSTTNRNSSQNTGGVLPASAGEGSLSMGDRQASTGALTSPGTQDTSTSANDSAGTRRTSPRDAARTGDDMQPGVARLPLPLLERRRSNEFSRYASKLVGKNLPLIGSDFFSKAILQGLPGSAGHAGPAVPAEYLTNTGDELLIQISGTLDMEVKQVVRRGGDITLPRVGAVRVAGVPASELANVLRTRLESQFRNIQVSASFVGLHGMRVFVTGFVELPGPHVVDSVSTITGAIAAAGGPAEGGSYRLAELWRKGKKVATFDLYEFLIQGDSSKDMLLTADDVIRVAPASSYQVAVAGSVNRPGVYELIGTEGLDELLRFAGGMSPVADRSRIASIFIDNEGQRKLAERKLGNAHGIVRLSPGEVLHVFSGATMNQGINATLKLVHVEGEVVRPGSYVLAANSTIRDAVAAAGGPTKDAFITGLSLVRPGLAQEQEVLLNRSLDELERSVFEASSRLSSNSGETGQASILASNAARAYIERLRQYKPTGRLIVHKSSTDAQRDPVLQDGDRVQVPPQPVTVSVFGAVYGEGSYYATKAGTLEQFLQSAGGLRPGADDAAIVVLKHDGSFVAARTGLFSFSKPMPIEPGDTIFVPTDAQRGRFWLIAKDVGQLLYQFGLGFAAIKALQ